MCLYGGCCIKSESRILKRSIGDVAWRVATSPILTFGLTLSRWKNHLVSESVSLFFSNGINNIDSHVTVYCTVHNLFPFQVLFADNCLTIPRDTENPHLVSKGSFCNQGCWFSRCWPHSFTAFVVVVHQIFIRGHNLIQNAFSHFISYHLFLAFVFGSQFVGNQVIVRLMLDLCVSDQLNVRFMRFRTSDIIVWQTCSSNAVFRVETFVS